MISKVIVAVVLVLVLLLLFVLLSPVSVRVRYRDTVSVHAGISFVRIKVFPRKEKKTPSVKRKKKQALQQEKKSTKKSSAHVYEKQKDGGEKSSAADTLTLVFDIVKAVFEMLGKHSKIRIDALKVTVAKDDAADTAVQFGVCSGIVSNILAFTSNFGTAVIKDENVRVEPDFVSGKSRFEADITLSVRALFLLSSLIKGYFANLSRK